jgi:hypothetical protein
MRPFRLRVTAFARVDWARLFEHLTAALLAALGAAIVSDPSGELWAVIAPALRMWAGAALVYAGGFIQNAEKLPPVEGNKDK